MILNPNLVMNNNPYAESKIAGKHDTLNRSQHSLLADDTINTTAECESDNDETDTNDQPCIYLTIDLSNDIVNKLKNLNTNELEQMKQMGILSVQFENDNAKVNIPFDPPPPPTAAVRIVETIKQEQRISTGLNVLTNQGGEVAKKRSRKTISELTSGAYAYDNIKEASLGVENVAEATTTSKKITNKNKRNSKESDSSFGTSSGTTPYVLTSCIVDQSPATNHPSTTAANLLSSQFQYMKQFTMPSPMLSNMLATQQQHEEHSSNDKLMVMDDYKHIYDMRQQLASQVSSSKQRSDEEKPKKQRRTNADPNKPKQKRTKQAKPESVQSTDNNTNSSTSFDQHRETVTATTNITPSININLPQQVVVQQQQHQQQQFYQPVQQQHIKHIINNNSNISSNGSNVAAYFVNPNNNNNNGSNVDSSQFVYATESQQPKQANLVQTNSMYQASSQQ